MSSHRPPGEWELLEELPCLLVPARGRAGLRSNARAGATGACPALLLPLCVGSSAGLVVMTAELAPYCLQPTPTPNSSGFLDLIGHLLLTTF